MTKLILAIGFAACAAQGMCSGNAVAAYGDIRPTGPVGLRLEQVIENHVLKTDVKTISTLFRDKTERNNRWQTEFWGKWMHAAVPLWTYSGSDALKAKIDAGIDEILASQEPDGYIGNYPEELRCGEGWDVWGMKYTMMGLLHFVDSEKSRVKSEECDGRGKRTLEACKKLCDYLIGQLGPNGKKGIRLYQTGNWSGLASSSVLEPVVWLYRRTGEKHYLDFADYIVKGMTEPEDGPRLVDLALRGISVADRNGYGGVKPDEHGNYVAKRSRSKAYEMMSCYQGMLDYVEVKSKNEKGRSAELDDLFHAVVATADQIIADEVNVAGGATSSEEWFHGAKKQHLPYLNLQETCVVTTWMRLLEKLLTVTGDPKYADQLERTFYNIYLASLNRDADEFAAYTPLNGYRSRGHHHCWMHTNCCNANGPRGFLSFLRALLQANGRTAYFNFYVSGTSRIALPADGRTVSFETYALYPRNGFVRIVNRTAGENAFELALRIPAWSARTKVRLNGEPVGGKAAPGGYLRLDRIWKTGDVVELDLDMQVVLHRLDHAVAFTRGPIALARDSRFNDGMIDEPLKLLGYGGIEAFKAPEFVPARNPSEEFAMTFAASLPICSHHEHPEGNVNPTVHFCDYASAANRWTPENGCRVWIPTEYAPWQDGERGAK